MYSITFFRLVDIILVFPHLLLKNSQVRKFNKFWHIGRSRYIIFQDMYQLLDGFSFYPKMNR